jgi:hypothetical protein
VGLKVDILPSPKGGDSNRNQAKAFLTSSAGSRLIGGADALDSAGFNDGFLAAKTFNAPTKSSLFSYPQLWHLKSA